jgi:hypothetical protein
MTKTKKRIIKITAAIAIALFLLQCLKCFILNLSDYPGGNNGVNEAKQRHVFIKKYNIIPNSIVVDKDTILIEEVWLEKPWEITDRCRDKIEIFDDLDYYRLKFKLSPTALEKLDKHYNSWMFKTYDKQLYSSACDGALRVVSYDIDKNLSLNRVSFVMFDDYPNNEKSHVVQKLILKESNN